MLSVQALSHARSIIHSPLPPSAYGIHGIPRRPLPPSRLSRGFNIHYLSAYYTISVNNHTCNLIENLERQAITPVYQTVDSRKDIAQDEKHH